MNRTFFTLLMLAGALARQAAYAQTNMWGQKDNTYHFGQPKKEASKKLPKTVPGRVHSPDGTTRNVPLAFLDYNKLVAVENGAQTVYTPLEAGGFVMKQDSFIVLRDFKVAIGADEQEFRIAFVRVGAVGPGYALYQFRGTMRREIGASFGAGGMGRVEESTQYLPAKVWFIKRVDDPRWLSLSPAGGQIRRVVEPLIADGVQDILQEYAANKRAVLK